MNFNVLLEKELNSDDIAIQNIRDGSNSTRILSFGVEPYRGEEGKTKLLHAIDLNTLSPNDIKLLTNPEYLEYAWKTGEHGDGIKPKPREIRDRLKNIINKKEGGNRGDKLFYHSGDIDYRKQLKHDAQGDGYLTDYERPVKSSSYKTYDADEVKRDGFIIFDLDKFKNVVDQLQKKNEEEEAQYTFDDLGDEYLRKASESDKPIPLKIEIDDEVEDWVDPEIVDDTPIKSDEIEDADAEFEEEPEVEIDSKFEPDADIETGEVDSELEPTRPEPTAKERPDIDIKTELEPSKPKKPKDIGDLIDRELAKIKPEPELEIKPEPELGIEPEPEAEPEPELEIEPESEFEPESEYEEPILASNKIIKGPMIIESMIDKALGRL